MAFTQTPYAGPWATDDASAGRTGPYIWRSAQQQQQQNLQASLISLNRSITGSDRLHIVPTPSAAFSAALNEFGSARLRQPAAAGLQIHKTGREEGCRQILSTWHAATAMSPAQDAFPWPSRTDPVGDRITAFERWQAFHEQDEVALPCKRNTIQIPSWQCS